MWRIRTFSGSPSFVAVVQTADVRHHHDGPRFRRLNRSWLCGVLPQRKMPPRSVIVIENTTSGFVVTSFHGTRSYDRGTHGERIQSPVRHGLSAKVSAVQTKLRRCPCLAPVLEIHLQRSHDGRAANSAEVGQRERPRAVAVPSTPWSGAR